jgi:hypothetical protein
VEKIKTGVAAQKKAISELELKIADIDKLPVMKNYDDMVETIRGNDAVRERTEAFALFIFSSP